MPFLSRKRKRKAEETDNTAETVVETNDSVNSDDISLVTSSAVNSSEVELLRTEQNCSRMSDTALIEPMVTDIVDQIDEQLSNRWADDVNLSQAEPSGTQFDKDFRNQMEEQRERERLNVAETGTIQSITLVNFMCHSHFHLPLGPRVNFIIGRNGSGKSAFLTAIVLGFGGRASTTSRGKGIASFIKCGETQAKITIQVCNSDERTNGRPGFKFEDYGKSILIERTINSSGASTYKIKSAAGKVMADRKDVLDEIIRHFNIQVDNPICVLNQEVSRNFLNTKNSRDKYTFFMKATLLEDMKNDYLSSETDRSIASKALEEKQRIIPEMKVDIKRLRQKVQMFNDLENHKERFEQLNKEALWAMVYEMRQKVNKIREQVNEYEKKLATELTKIESEKELMAQLETERNKLSDQLSGLAEDVQQRRDALDQFKQNCRQIKDNIQDKDRAKRDIERELISTNQDIKRLADKIKELEKQFSNESHNNRKTKISELKEEMEKLSEEERDLVNKSKDLNDSATDLGAELIRLRQQLNHLCSTINDKVSQRDQLNRSRKERLQRFGPKYPELVRLIDEAHKRGKFERKPIGPIGNHIQLKDHSCALAVELCLKRTLYGFCCHNLADQRTLKDIIDKHFGNERKPPIITRPFTARHDVSQREVRSHEYKSLLQLMVIKEDPVANVLIDQLRIESILFIPDYKSAQDLLIDRQTAPQNCYRAYTQDGCIMIPSTDQQDYRTYANNTDRRNATILIKNVDQIMGVLEEEVRNLNERKQTVQKEVDAKNQLSQSKHRELNGFQTRIKQIRSEIIKSDTQLKKLEAIGDSPPVEISTLEDELHTRQSKVTDLEDKLQTVKQEKEELNQLYTEADEQLVTKKSEYDTLMARRHPIKEQMDKIDSDLKNHSLVLAKYEKQMAETEALKTEEEELLAAKEAECQRDETTALEASGEPIQTTRSSNTVFKQIEQLDAFLKEQENSIGNKEEIYQNYEDLIRHFKRIYSEMSGLDKHLKRLEKSLELRRKGYVELRNFYSMMTKFFFMDVLKWKKFSGSLDIYHREKIVNGETKKAKTLEIRVNPKTEENSSSQSISSSVVYSDTRSLSGGERSYSTVAFILALWESAQSPFKILDEVDVFMDLVTRQISLDAMIDFASQKSGKQYIFLSPLKLQRLPSPELIQIFKMPEPIREDQ